MHGSVGPLECAAKAAFYVVAAVTLAGAFMAVSARNLFRSALGLALCLFGVAAIYFFLEAEFLAVTQLLVYVGAILTLIIFGVMLTNRIADPTVERWNKQVKWAAGLVLVLAAGLTSIFLKTPWPIPSIGSNPPVQLPTLGRTLVSGYLLPFELLSILLLGALVGAIVVARKEKT